jgi:Tfp pilus assembly protein PilP
MSGAKGLDTIKKEKGERRSAILDDKMLMNKSRREVNRARQTPRRRKGPLEAYTLHHRVLQ